MLESSQLQRIKAQCLKMMGTSLVAMRVETFSSAKAGKNLKPKIRAKSSCKLLGSDSLHKHSVYVEKRYAIYKPAADKVKFMK